MSNPRRYLQEEFEIANKDLNLAEVQKKIDRDTAAYEALLRERRQVFYPVTKPSQGPWGDNVKPSEESKQPTRP